MARPTRVGSAAFTLATLGFHSVWLMGWTLGVSFIQGILLSGEVPFLLIFMVTHGGAEVLVIREVTSKLRGGATVPAGAPTVELEHDRVRAVWPNGNGSVVIGLAAAVLGTAIHTALFGAIVYGLYEGIGLIDLLLGPVLAAVWTYTGWLFVRTVLAHLTHRGEIVLTADLDTVEVEYDGALVDRTVQLPLHDLTIDESLPDRLTLAAGEASASVPILDGPETDELIGLLRTMAKRTTVAEPVQVPEGLAALRHQAE